MTRVLAEQGADVISIRNPLFDFLYSAIYGESYGKKQIFVNFKSPQGKSRLTELIKSADVLVWGYHYPALERLGFSLETLKALNPNLVLRPLDYVTKLVSGLLTCKLPLDGDPVAVHGRAQARVCWRKQARSPIRRFPKHCRESKPTSISAWFSQLPCLGV